MRHTVSLGNLVIASGATDSGVLLLTRTTETLIDMIVFTPSALTGTVSLYAGPRASGLAAENVILRIGGTDVTLPAARAVHVPSASFRQLQARSTVAEASGRTFEVIAQVDVGV